MLDRYSFIAAAGIEAEVLEAWIEAGWLTPRREADVHRFSEVDVARARLIWDLRNDLGINDEGVGVVLDLLEQVHGLRRALRSVVASLHAQPDEVRLKLIADLEAVFSGPTGKVDL
jgi:chaperone modulatory protein CbpM